MIFYDAKLILNLFENLIKNNGEKLNYNLRIVIHPRKKSLKNI